MHYKSTNIHIKLTVWKSKLYIFWWLSWLWHGILAIFENHSTRRKSRWSWIYDLYTSLSILTWTCHDMQNVDYLVAGLVGLWSAVVEVPVNRQKNHRHRICNL